MRLGKHTDRDWEQFGREDPYFGVIFDPKFRRGRLTPESIEEFFASGRAHADRLFEIAAHVDPGFAPKHILDFGCGVGRLLVVFATRGERVVGADVSESMLREAERNCAERGITNVTLVRADGLSIAELDGPFDLVHSFLVLQHVPVARGHRILERLVDLVAEGGLGIFHVTFANELGRRARLVRWARGRCRPLHRLLNRREGRPPGQPLMQMNRYDLNLVFRTLQDHGMHDCHVRFTNHFGHRGVLLFARKQRLQGF